MEGLTETERQILAAYKATLALPADDARLPAQIFLAPVGRVGAGKTTVVKPLAERLGLVRISSDEIRRLLKELGHDYKPLRSIARTLAFDLARAGYGIAFDKDCANPETKAMIEEIAAERSARVFWLHINPPEAFILNKLRTYDHTWLFKDAEQAVGNYFDQKRRRAEENTHIDYFAEIDPSRLDLPQQLADVENRIRTALGA
ncbi:AAA family ATPase [Patescibacteria group bacterium]|nr:AAA family ATPase [Patescibacteria group bacterium]